MWQGLWAAGCVMCEWVYKDKGVAPACGAAQRLSSFCAHALIRHEIQDQLLRTDLINGYTPDNALMSIYVPGYPVFLCCNDMCGFCMLRSTDSTMTWKQRSHCMWSWGIISSCAQDSINLTVCHRKLSKVIFLVMRWRLETYSFCHYLGSMDCLHSLRWLDETFLSNFLKEIPSLSQ